MKLFFKNHARSFYILFVTKLKSKEKQNDLCDPCLLYIGRVSSVSSHSSRNVLLEPKAECNSTFFHKFRVLNLFFFFTVICANMQENVALVLHDDTIRSR